MSKVSRLMAVDASVLRSAGNKSGHSANCQEVLKYILEICHRVVFSKEIGAEWSKHQSNYAATWRASMVARRKLVRTDLTLEMGRLVAEIQMHDELGEKTKNGLLKDAHMLAAGLLGDRILITGDKLLKAYAVYLRRNSEIEWLMIVDGNDSLHRSLLIRLGELSKAKTPQVNKP